MPTLSALANIPGYGAYVAKREMNEQQGMQDLQQASALLQLRNAIQGQQQDEQLKQTLSASAGDVEAALNAAIRSGNLGAAAKLAPLVEARRRAENPQGQAIGSGGLRLPDGTIVPPAARPDTAPKAPPHRQRFDGLNIVQEELQPDGTWKQVGSGPRFAPDKPARETFPIVTTGDGIFERRPEGLVPLKDPKTGQPLRPTARERPITEFQGKNALYGSRALMSDKTLTDLETKISTVGLNAKQAVQGMPVIGGPAGAILNATLSANQQSVEQAQRNFVNAVLRQESGAVISDQEFENAKKQYFPAPGDKPAVIAQKRANRQAAIQGFKRIAGPAWDGVEDQLKPSSPTDVLNAADEILKGNNGNR